MARSPKLTAKPSRKGDKVVVTFPTQRLRSIAATLPEGEDRTALLKAVDEAETLKSDIAREMRLETALSIESLSPLGWMIVGTHSSIAYGAIREGDFRLDEAEGRRGWVHGPSGAFDREPEGTTIMRGAVQAGVMSESTAFYLLEEPTMDRTKAISQALSLETAWRAILPATSSRPEMLIRDAEQGFTPIARTQWPHYYTREEVGLPDEARKAGIRMGVGNATLPTERDGPIHSSGNIAIHMFHCDAMLRPEIVCDRLSTRISTRGMAWETSTSRWNNRHPICDGPYDCVLGKVWAVLDATPRRWNGGPTLCQTHNSGSADNRDRQVFPLATREEALTAARNLAIREGALKGDETQMPETIAVPEQTMLDMAQAA